MSKLRVHELARELGRQNKEVIEFLKSKGIDVKSHMSMVDEPAISIVRDRFKKNNNRGKEHIAKLDTPKTEEKVVTAKSEGDKTETPKKKKNIIRVFHAQNASDGGKTRKKPVKAEGERTGSPRNAEGTKASDNSRTDGDRPRRNNDRSNAGNRRPQGDGQRQGRSQGEGRAQGDGNRQGGRFGQGRTQGDGQRQGRPQGDGNRQGGRFGQGRTQGDGQGRQGGRFQGDGNRQGGRFGQGRPQGDNRQGGRPQGNGQGRPDGNRSEGRDGRFSGGQGRQGQRQNTRKNDDMVFAPELTKTSKDSKRERDRENKNKKKDFDKTQSSGGRRPNQGGFNKNSRIPKALQKPAPQPKQEEKKPEVKEITLPEKMTIRELAEAMKMQPSVIVKKLFMQGMMVTVNHEIDFEKAQEIALEYDIIAEPEEKVDVIEELLKEDEEDEKDMVSRPPVVCVMGHVDHGKTSLLDAIRKTNVTRGEAGGITQHIGASVVEVGGQKITFLDTPGHEAFTAMRMRGAQATDIAILVVAADDGVMPQTIEAINHAKAAGVEIIVAVNKIDKPNANIEKVKQELTEYELIAEDWGGSTTFVPVSAHTKEGIDELLEMILLTAEVNELKANPDRKARGIVIEAELDKGRGPVATILVQKGTLRVGDAVAAGSCYGKIRAMIDDKGRRVKEATPSMPVEILGLNDVPNAGEIIMATDNEKEARNIADTFIAEGKKKLLDDTKHKVSLDALFEQIQAGNMKELDLIIKADVQGSVEAVKQSLVKLSNEEVIVKVIHGGVGNINESDVVLASASNAIIIGFNVKPDNQARIVAEREKVDLRLYSVIYNAIEDVEAALKGMLEPIYEEKIIGHAEIRQIFKASGVGNIAGAIVTEGRITRDSVVRITRDKEQIYEGPIATLKHFKDDVKEVKAGSECGMVFENFGQIQEGDLVEAHIMVEVPR